VIDENGGNGGGSWRSQEEYPRDRQPHLYLKRMKEHIVYFTSVKSCQIRHWSGVGVSVVDIIRVRLHSLAEVGGYG
jgi:hypothetical protein